MQYVSTFVPQAKANNILVVLVYLADYATTIASITTMLERTKAAQAASA